MSKKMKLVVGIVVILIVMGFIEMGSTIGLAKYFAH